MKKLIRLIGLHKLVLAFSDLTILLGVATAILFARWQLSPYNPAAGEAILFAVSSLVAVIVFREIHLYRHRLFTTRTDQIVAIGKGMLYVGIVQIVALFLIKNTRLIDYSRINIALFIFGGWIALALFRVAVFRSVFLRIRAASANPRRVLVIGAGRAAQALAAKVEDQPELGLKFVAFIDDDPMKIGGRMLGAPVLGDIDRVAEIVTEVQAEEIYVAINEIAYERLLEIIDHCRATNLPVTVTTDHIRIIPHRIGTQEFDYIDSLTLRPGEVDRASWQIKRLADIVGSTFLIALLSPLLVVIALAVRLTSPGPIFYRSRVVGRGGRQFTWYKFRTMVADRDDALHREHLRQIITQNGTTEKLRNDPRVTAVGRLLRKYSLDELPQLFNVLRGEMSLIGPRPCLQYEYDQFDDWHKQRFVVTPGMTGLWQVVGRNKSDVTFNDSVILDLYYIRNYSIWLDVKIALRTIPAVVFGRGGA